MTDLAEQLAVELGIEGVITLCEQGLHAVATTEKDALKAVIDHALQWDMCHVSDDQLQQVLGIACANGWNDTSAHAEGEIEARYDALYEANYELRQQVRDDARAYMRRVFGW